MLLLSLVIELWLGMWLDACRKIDMIITPLNNIKFNNKQQTQYGYSSCSEQGTKTCLKYRSATSDDAKLQNSCGQQPGTQVKGRMAFL